MSSNKEKINGYILAGGKSTRMGEDKGLMELHNKPVIEYVINQLKPAVNNIVIVSNNKEYAKFGYEVIEDIIRNIGPSAGIHTVLCHSKTERNFVVSCDMPFITTDSIEYLINESEGSQITIPVYKDKYEPMYAVYSKECLAQWVIRHTMTVGVAQSFADISFNSPVKIVKMTPLSLTGDHLKPSPYSRVGIVFFQAQDQDECNALYEKILKRGLYDINV